MMTNLWDIRDTCLTPAVQLFWISNADVNTMLNADGTKPLKCRYENKTKLTLGYTSTILRVHKLT